MLLFLFQQAHRPGLQYCRPFSLFFEHAAHESRESGRGGGGVRKGEGGGEHDVKERRRDEREKAKEVIKKTNEMGE